MASENMSYYDEDVHNGQNRRQRLAYGLGLFSIGLGAAEVIAPGKLAELIGINDDDKTRNLLRGYGVREIATGIGILSQPGAAGWLWGRVGGDLLDLASLASAMKANNVDRTRVTAATAAVAGVAALDVYCGRQLSRQSRRDSGRNGFRILKSVAISKSPEEVYGFWRNFENLPRFMSHLEAVNVIDNRRSHWRAKAPAGRTVQWDAEMVEDRPNDFISWRSLEGADVDNSGTVRFERAPAGRGTIVHVELNYAPPGGSLGKIVAKLFGEAPDQQLDDDLRALKQILEVGEIVKSDASIHRGMHPAQPPAW